MDQHFREAFEKESGLKELALAGSLALSPAAKAFSDDAARTTLRAVKKTPVGQQVSAKLKTYQDKVKDFIKARPDLPEGPIVRAQGSAQAGSATAPTGPSPKISLRDLGTVNLKYKDFQATASPNNVRARYNINSNSFVEAFKRGDNSGIRVGYNKSF